LYGIYKGQEVNSIVEIFFSHFEHSTRTKSSVKMKVFSVRSELVKKLTQKEDQQGVKEIACIYSTHFCSN